MLGATGAIGDSDYQQFWCRHADAVRILTHAAGCFMTRAALLSSCELPITGARRRTCRRRVVLAKYRCFHQKLQAPVPSSTAAMSPGGVRATAPRLRDNQRK